MHDMIRHENVQIHSKYLSYHMLYVKFGSVIGSVPITQQLDDQYRLPKIDI